MIAPMAKSEPQPFAPGFSPHEDFARELDNIDPIAAFRERFHIPLQNDGTQVVYLAGNSLGLQPTGVKEAIEQELSEWAWRGVDAHFDAFFPWYSYHELLRDTGAKLVGARSGEVVTMNSLTVNLHLMMVSFYRPTRERYKILIDEPCFPSDLYALQSQLRLHGFDPREAIITVKPRAGESCIRFEDFEEILSREGERVALILVGGVNFVTGQFFDLPQLTLLGHRFGCIVGFDLAHAAGNVPLQLHEWNVDFAVWCNYKYLNSGPGAVGSCFVHERHHSRSDLHRLGGWWGNDPATRFRMNLQTEFVPRQNADGWQISNPPILALCPVRVSYDLFAAAGMNALREKSVKLTMYLLHLLEKIEPGFFEVISPTEPRARGCQISLRIFERPKELVRALHQAGIVCDFREPDVIRAAPVPLYNTFHDAWRFAHTLAGMSHERR